MTATLTKRRLLTAFGWTSAGTALSYGLSFLRSIILARLLFPSDYGLFGLAAGVLTGLNVFTEFSLASNIVVTKFPSEEEERVHLNTVWTAGLVRGGLLAAVAFVSAWPVAAWFHDGRLLKIFMIVAVAPLITAFQNVGLVKLQKELAFKTLTIQQRVADGITFVITIALALLTHNYLALVGSQLVSAITMVWLSYRLCSYRPALAFNSAAFRDCLHFGKPLFIISILTFINTQFDNFAVGHYIGAAALGAYLLAYRLAMLPVDALISILNSVLFPVYSRVQLAEPERLGAFFLKLNRVSATLVFASVAPFAIAPQLLIGVLYGGRWAAAVEPLRILAFAGLFRGLTHTISPLLVSVRRPDLDAKCKVVEASLFVTLIVILVPRFGTSGAAWAGVASYAVAYVMRLVIAAPLLRAGSSGRALFGLVQPFVIGGLAFAASHLVLVTGARGVVSLGLYYGVLLGVTYVMNRFVRVEVRKAIGSVYCRVMGQRPKLRSAPELP